MRTLKLGFVALMALSLIGGTPALAIAQEDAAARPSEEGMELVPGLEFVTEEIEPGVYRVTSDGVRELNWPIEWYPVEGGWWPAAPGTQIREQARAQTGLVANADGVWLRRPEGILRLGEPEPVWIPQGEARTPDFTVTSDGTLYQVQDGTLGVLREDGWEKVRVPADRLGLREVDRVIVGPDATLWVVGNNGKASDEEKRKRLARRDADGWSRVRWLPVTRDRRYKDADDWQAAGGGAIYASQGRRLRRFDGDRWTNFEQTEKPIRDLMVGADGTVWLDVGDLQYQRVGTDGWVTHEAGSWHLDSLAESVVAMDGTLWYTATGDPLANGGCDGVVRTDGTTTMRFLDDRCIHDLAIGPEGTVWAMASWWFGNYFSPESVSPVEVFAITPEAWGAVSA